MNDSIKYPNLILAHGYLFSEAGGDVGEQSENIAQENKLTILSREAARVVEYDNRVCALALQINTSSYQKSIQI